MRPIGDGADIPDDINPEVLDAWEERLQGEREAYDRAFDRTQEAQRRLQELIRSRDLLQSDLNNVLAQIPGAEAAVARTRQQAADLGSRRDEHRAARDASTARLLGTERLDGMVKTAQPLLLLPVRLETRFMSARNGSTELWVRVYPDDIHIDSHEPGLTEEEERWGKHFWKEVNAGSGSDKAERKRQAWQQLVDRFSAERAAWVARVLDPAKPELFSRRAGTWTRAPYTEVLPDRWVAIGYSDERPAVTAWGKLIPDRLPTGPSPEANSLAEGKGLPAIDEGMRWMIDFQAAEAIGMALRIPLTEEQARCGFKRLVVVGVKASLGAAASAARLAALLDGHHYTGGLAFVPQNLPTNNTAEVSSGYSTAPGDAAASFPVELGDSLVQPGSDGEIAAKALGVGSLSFSHIRGADGTEQKNAGAMNQALFPICDSPIVRELSAATGAAFLREHFIHFVRARGPLPTLRVGEQPYGLLPAAPLDLEQSLDGVNEEGALAAWWQSRRPLRRQSAARALRLDQEENLLRLLSQEGNAGRYLIRVFDDDGSVPSDPLPLKTSPLRDQLLNHAIGLLNDPAVVFLKTLPEALRQGLIAEALDLAAYRLDAWATSLATRRLSKLRERNPEGIRLGGYGWVEDLRRGAPLKVVTPLPAKMTGPLYRSEGNKGFVQAPSLAHAATAAVIRSGYLSHQDGESGESPFAVDLSSDRVHRAKWMLEGVREGQPLAALLGYRFERGLHEQKLDRYIHRFRTLASLKEDDALAKAYEKVAKAERLVREAGALYEERDEMTRRSQNARLLKAERERKRLAYQNEFEAVTALERQVAATEVRVVQLNQTITQHQAAIPRSVVRKATGNRFEVGLIEAGDLQPWTDRMTQLSQERQTAAAQASTMRSKLNAQAGSRIVAQAAMAKLADPNHPNSIPAAERMITDLQAIAADFDRQGLEKEGGSRGKAEADLAAARAEVAALLNRQWGQALESLAASNVVDGLELHRRWKAGQRRTSPQPQWDATTIPFGNAALGFPDPGSDDFKALDAELRALDNLVDSVGDTVVAESVYQLVQGNPLRSGATLDAIAAGELPPPELEVIRTPRTGIGLTHRLLVLFPATAGKAPSAWPTDENQVRAKTEPLLNAWAAALLPNPDQVRCKADYVDPKSGAVYRTVEAALKVLKLSPLDVVFMAEGDEEAQRSELEQRLVYSLLRKRPASVPADAEVRLNFARNDASGEINGGQVSFGEFLEMARRARQLFAGARPLDGRDLSLPESPAASGLKTKELTQRTEKALNAFGEAQKGLELLLPTEPTGREGGVNLEALRKALFRIASFGIQGAVPLAAVGEGPELRTTLLTQARSIQKEVARRLGRIADQAGAFDAGRATPEEQRDFDLVRLKELFGADFRALPQLTPANSPQLAEAFGASLALQGNDPQGAITWFQRAAYVRDGVMRLEGAMVYAETLGAGAALALQVGQLPYRSGDRWVGLTAGPDQTIPAGRISLVAYTPLGSARFNQPLAGLLIDEWVEVVPSRRETTGLTFHYDQPNSSAPQAILLAVPSDQREVWDLDYLEATLRETMSLARMRAAAPDSRAETVWVEDDLPAGALPFGEGEGWSWVRLHPEPLSGKRAHQSAVAAGMHQHYFQRATATLPVSVGDRLFAYVYLDPRQMPREVMLQWNEGSWEHRAYWGENLLDWGVDGTVSRQAMGPLPPGGEWVRLEVPAAAVGLEGRVVSGMAFTLWDGRATWDRAGKVSQQPAEMGMENLLGASLFFGADAIDFSSVVETGGEDGFEDPA